MSQNVPSEKMSSKKEIIKNRREKLKGLIMRSYHTQEELAKALGMTRKTIQRDMEVIKEEIKTQAGEGKFEDLLNDFMAKITASYNDVSGIIAGSADENVKLKGQRLLNELRESRIKILQSLGIVRELAPLERKAVVVKFVKPEWMTNENSGDENKPELPAVQNTEEVSQQPKEV